MSRASIGFIYKSSRTSSPLAPQTGYVNHVNTGLYHPILTVGEQDGVDLDDSKLEQEMDEELGIEGVIHDVPGSGFFGDVGRFAFKNILAPAVKGILSDTFGLGLTPTGGGILDTAIELDRLAGGGSLTLKRPFPQFSRLRRPIDLRSSHEIQGEGLKALLNKLSRNTSPFLKRQILPIVSRLIPQAKKKLLPVVEKQLDLGLGRAQAFLKRTPIGDLSSLLPADKLKMQVLKRLRGKGLTKSKASPKLQISHPAFAHMDGGQLGILAAVASSLLIPAISGIFKNIF